MTWKRLCQKRLTPPRKPSLVSVQCAVDAQRFRLISIILRLADRVSQVRIKWISAVAVGGLELFGLPSMYCDFPDTTGLVESDTTEVR
jgi:hypothetical protein